MNKSIVFAFLIVIVLGTHRQGLDYSNKRSMINILMEVENKIKLNSPLESVLNILREFKDAVNIEQVSHDEIYTQQEKECKSENDYRDKEVTDSHRILKDSSVVLTNCQTQKQRLTEQNEVNQRQTFKNEERLKMVTVTREFEQQLYKYKSQNYEDSLYAIDEALDIVEALYNGSNSFLDLSKVSKKMLQNAIQLKTLLHYAPVLSSFAQITRNDRNLDQTELERVAHQLDTLRTQIKDSYNDFASSNAEAIQAYNNQTENLKANLDRLNLRTERLEKKLDGVNQCIGTQSAIATASSNKYQRNSQLWDQSKSLCATFTNEYNYATASRRNELKLVSELENMVERRFAQVEDQKPNMHHI